MLQMDDGHFPGDYGGPMFLMPGMLISCYVTGVLNTVLSPQHKSEMIRYIKNHQNEDGGFGLHIEGHSTMFGTGLRFAAVIQQPALHVDIRNQDGRVLSCCPLSVSPSVRRIQLCVTEVWLCSYVALRILGIPVDDKCAERARSWVRSWR